MNIPRLIMSVAIFASSLESTMMRALTTDYIPDDYIWTTQSVNSSESMPCGGGDIGMNIWAEKGDILFYVSRSGFFDENNTLLKAGRFRLHFDSRGASADTSFVQRLCLDDGAMYITLDGVRVRIWADVTSPCIFVEITSADKVDATVSYESWRYRDRPISKGEEAQQCSYKWLDVPDLSTSRDSVTPHRHSIAFFHQNPDSTVFDYTVRIEHLESIKGQLYNPIGGKRFGGVMYAPDFSYAGFTDGVYTGTDYLAWHYRAKKITSGVIAIALDESLGDVTKAAEESRERSSRWWHAFWQRSFIIGEGECATICRNYELFRYMLGCNARGEWPTKFNGGLFTFDPVYVSSQRAFTPDYRCWGGGTMTAQNQRLVYWPMLKSGDIDMMASQLDTYMRMLPNAVARTKYYWGHDGASFTEQIENYGLPNPAEYGKRHTDYGVEDNRWLEYLWDTSLEFCEMAILTGQTEKYRPLIEECVAFFDEHYKTDNDTLLLYPGSGCETFKIARNASSTIAALRVIKRQMGMKDNLPAIPLRQIMGRVMIAPAESWQRVQNVESPQLYPVFPWHLYGLGRPDIDIARNTYLYDTLAVKFRSSAGWKQDCIWAADLGLTDEAARLTKEKLADGPYRFPAFWPQGFDWAPDCNRGGAGMIALQEMLLQDDRLFPATPKNWKIKFRLHTTDGKVVEGEQDGTGAEWIGAITRSASGIPDGRFPNTVFKSDSFKTKWADVDTLSARSIILSKSFPLRGGGKARLSICGLGHYEVSINGRRIGDDMFVPAWSEYDKTVYYNVYDVDSVMTDGMNRIDVLLGNGFFNVQRGDRYSKLQASYGPPRLLCFLEMTGSDGVKDTIVSDTTWRYALSPVTFNSIYGGESYDARMEDSLTWHKVKIMESPKGQLMRQTAPPVRIMERYNVSQWLAVDSDSIASASKETKRNIDAGVMIADMGQNLSGFPEIKVRGRRGSKITLLCSENLNAQGVCDQRQTGRPHYYEYILKGDSVETWHPRFSYYGFRYIQVEGAAPKENDRGLPVLLDLTSDLVSSSAAEVSSLLTDNDLINRIHRLIERAERSNMQGVLTDCPHREKLGWLEQDHLMAPSLLYNFDLSTYIPKIIRDITDSQKDDGMIPTTAPQYVPFGSLFDNSPEWGSTLIILPFMYYDHYGDSTLITRNYTAMRRYVDYLSSRSEGGVIDFGLGDWYDYRKGEKSGFSKNTSIALVATAHYILDLKYIVRAARMVGEDDDAERYDALLGDVVQAFNKRFYNKEKHSYDTGSQTANSLPLFLGITPDSAAVLSSLIEDIHAHGDRLTTGDVGNRYLFCVLARAGQSDLLYKMVNHYDTPGYGYQLRQGATTLTEQWNPRQGSSWNHFMMGQIDEWFFSTLAGIRNRPGEHGLRHLLIEPALPGDIRYVKASTLGGGGLIKVEATPTTMTVDIPYSSDADIITPWGERRHVTSGRHSLGTIQ